MSTKYRPQLVADGHVPTIAEMHDRRWGVQCHACSQQAEDYVWPCREGVTYEVPAELVAASELETARAVALSNKRAHETAYLECERLSGELETARAELAKGFRVVVVTDTIRDRVHCITADNEYARQQARELIAKHGGNNLAATMTVDVVYPLAAPAVVSGTSQAAADDDWVTVLDDAIAASGLRLVFDPRNWTEPHTQRGPKASDPDREHPAHVGQTCDEYDAAVAGTDDLDVHLAEQMADPQFRVAYEAAERAVAGTGEQAAPTARLCTDKNGFHDPHDYYDDPCDVQSIYCPGYPVPKKADAAPAPTPAEGVPTAHQR
jgi:hypothetical protein